MDFRSMLGLIAHQPRLVEAIETLLARKQAAPEMGAEAPVPILQQFIEQELDQPFTPVPPPLQSQDHLDKLNQLFQEQLQEAWNEKDA